MKLIEFFDPRNPQHLEWYNRCGKESYWPEEAIAEFTNNGVVMGNVFEEGIQVMSKIAHSYMKQVLCEDFICPPGFKKMENL